MYKFLFFIFLIMSFQMLLAQKAERDTLLRQLPARSEYDSVILKGEAAVNNKDFIQAREYYKQAVYLRPADIFAHKMLQNVNNSIRALAEFAVHDADLRRKAEINILLSKGQTAVIEKKYDSARVFYVSVLALSPVRSQEEFVKQKIKALDLALNRTPKQTAEKSEVTTAAASVKKQPDVKKEPVPVVSVPQEKKPVQKTEKEKQEENLQKKIIVNNPVANTATAKKEEKLTLTPNEKKIAGSSDTTSLQTKASATSKESLVLTNGEAQPVPPPNVLTGQDAKIVIEKPQEKKPVQKTEKEKQVENLPEKVIVNNPVANTATGKKEEKFTLTPIEKKIAGSSDTTSLQTKASTASKESLVLTGEETHPVATSSLLPVQSDKAVIEKPVEKMMSQKTEKEKQGETLIEKVPVKNPEVIPPKGTTAKGTKEENIASAQAKKTIEKSGNVTSAGAKPPKAGKEISVVAARKTEVASPLRKSPEPEDKIAVEKVIDAPKSEKTSQNTDATKHFYTAKSLLNLLDSNNSVKLVCWDISFVGKEIQIRFLIQNESNNDFIPGSQQLMYIQNDGTLKTLNGHFLPDVTTVPANREATVVYVVDAPSAVQADEVFVFEMEDKLKKTRLTINISGDTFIQK